MAEQAERGRRRKYRLVFALTLLAAVLALLIVPPLVSIGRYKNRITQLISTSLGRPVRLSSVELRLVPRPGFVITDLTVEEDPAYGAEPVLHANTVVAAVRLWSLWRGRLEISRISVDEASLNLVRNDAGRWNLDPFFHAATFNAGRNQIPPFPYLEATNSRINVKKGIEKLPYSVVNADLSFWQESPSEWRVRLRGQPARTDVSLDLADTGIMRLEARMHRSADASPTRFHVDLDWREAQLGQLSRLILGSDPGWRGNLTGQVQVDGTAEAAQVKTRLTASGVHRAEFAPPEPLDFDANCNFIYHYLDRGVEKLSCVSPLGDGHVIVQGDLPGNASPRLSVEVQRIPVSAGLDVLRTMRSGFNTDLEARGTASGRIAYDPASTQESNAEQKTRNQPGKDVRASLTGSLTLDGLRLSGGGLSQPVTIPKTTLVPTLEDGSDREALSATTSFPAGGSVPIALAVRLSLAGYEASIRGPASLPRLRELAHVGGVEDVSALDGLAGEPVIVDLNAQGPWLSAPRVPSPAISASGMPSPLLNEKDADQLNGTVTFHNVSWTSQALANHVQISQAVLHLNGGGIVWDPVEFAYGPIKGSADFQVPPAECSPAQTCLAQLDLRFGSLDSAALQAALMGGQQKTTVLSALIGRFSGNSSPDWPPINGTVQVDSFTVGPVKLRAMMALVQIVPTGVEFRNLNAELLGGQLHATGKLTRGDKPSYAFDGDLDRLSGPAVCQLLGMRCAGGVLVGKGKVELTGFTNRDLAASAHGTLHLEWRRGSIQAAQDGETPKPLGRFDRWVADAAIANNQAVIVSSEVEQGSRKAEIDATVTFSDPPRVKFGPAKPAESAQK